MKQVCIYAFPYNALIAFGSIKEKTPLEKIEDIELLRALDIGLKIKTLNLKERLNVK